jgi:ABC-type uncharacterized transport system involved in gliding motility auxiliary subunit
VTERARHELFERRLVDGLFYVLLAVAVVLAGWLGARHDLYWDWTQTGRNSPSEETVTVLARLSAPLRITVFAERSQPIGQEIAKLLALYRRAKSDLEVAYVDPQRFPEQAREADVSLVGQILLEYRGRRETLDVPSEEALTAAIARIGREERPWIAVLEGHGERSIEGGAAPDLGRFAEILRGRGYRLEPLDLATIATVPENIRLLLLSAPSIALFPGEEQAIIDYLKRGGNLLLLADPGESEGLRPIMDYLGIQELPGLMVDANVAELKIEDPTVAMVADYPDHPVTHGLSQHSLFPGSVAFAAWAAEGWTLATPLQTRKNSWNETGPILGDVIREQGLGELPGPLPLALAMTRPAPQRPGEQRVLVLGDGDFLSNAYLGIAGNRALALRAVQWLTAPEGTALVPTRTFPDRDLTLTATRSLVIGGGALVALPVLFLLAGLIIRWRRRRG